MLELHLVVGLVRLFVGRVTLGSDCVIWVGVLVYLVLVSWVVWVWFGDGFGGLRWLGVGVV